MFSTPGCVGVWPIWSKIAGDLGKAKLVFVDGSCSCEYTHVWDAGHNDRTLLIRGAVQTPNVESITIFRQEEEKRCVFAIYMWGEQFNIFPFPNRRCFDGIDLSGGARQIRNQVKNVDNIPILEAVLRSERAGKNRQTVIRRVSDRINTLENRYDINRYLQSYMHMFVHEVRFPPAKPQAWG